MQFPHHGARKAPLGLENLAVVEDGYLQLLSWLEEWALLSYVHGSCHIWPQILLLAIMPL